MDGHIMSNINGNFDIKIWKSLTKEQEKLPCIIEIRNSNMRGLSYIDELYFQDKTNWKK